MFGCYLCINFISQVKVDTGVVAGALLHKYRKLVDSQELKPDMQQLACVQQLSRLCDQLSEYNTHVEQFQVVCLKYMVCCAVWAQL